jgi:hypothetical protein
MKRYGLAILFCLFATSVVFAQPKSPLEGVWKITERITPGSDQRAREVTNPRPLPSVIIFTKGYYSQVYETGAEPRSTVARPKDPHNLTDAEKIARYEQWRPFNANSGTYEIKGTRLIIHPIVSKSFNLMTGTGHAQEFKLEGLDTLWLIPIPEEIGIEPRLKLVRLE